MTPRPSGLRFSERKLWDECPEARPVLARLARMRGAPTRSLWRFPLMSLVVLVASIEFSVAGNYAAAIVCAFWILTIAAWADATKRP